MEVTPRIILEVGILAKHLKVPKDPGTKSERSKGMAAALESGPSGGTS